MDYITPIMTGLFTGIGVGLANWIHSRHIESRLDKINSLLKRKDE